MYKVCQSLAAGRWISPDTPASSTWHPRYNWTIAKSGAKHNNPI